MSSRLIEPTGAPPLWEPFRIFFLVIVAVIFWAFALLVWLFSLLELRLRLMVLAATVLKL